MSELEAAFSSGSFVNSSLKATTSDTSFTVAEASNFSYTDPIDGSVSKNQGLYVTFTDGSRVVFRLSGTGSSGATIRLYVEKYSKNESEYAGDTQEGLKPLIEVALSLSKLVETTGRKEPTVITVSAQQKRPCDHCCLVEQWLTEIASTVNDCVPFRKAAVEGQRRRPKICAINSSRSIFTLCLPRFLARRWEDHIN